MPIVGAALFALVGLMLVCAVLWDIENGKKESHAGKYQNRKPQNRLDEVAGEDDEATRKEPDAWREENEMKRNAPTTFSSLSSGNVIAEQMAPKRLPEQLIGGEIRRSICAPGQQLGSSPPSTGVGQENLRGAMKELRK